MPNKEVKIDFVSDPLLDLVPPDIFLATTRCRTARSAGLLSEAMLENLTKVNSSEIYLVPRAARVEKTVACFR